MTDDDIYKAKIEVLAEMTKSFYVDFMPIVKEVQQDISTLKFAEENKIVINHINENLSKAEAILNSLKKYF